MKKLLNETFMYDVWDLDIIWVKNDYIVFDMSVCLVGTMCGFGKIEMNSVQTPKSRDSGINR